MEDRRARAGYRAVAVLAGETDDRRTRRSLRHAPHAQRQRGRAGGGTSGARSAAALRWNSFRSVTSSASTSALLSSSARASASAFSAWRGTQQWVHRLWLACRAVGWSLSCAEWLWLLAKVRGASRPIRGKLTQRACLQIASAVADRRLPVCHRAVVTGEWHQLSRTGRAAQCNSPDSHSSSWQDWHVCQTGASWPLPLRH